VGSAGWERRNYDEVSRARVPLTHRWLIGQTESRSAVSASSVLTKPALDGIGRRYRLRVSWNVRWLLRVAEPRKASRLGCQPKRSGSSSVAPARDALRRGAPRKAASPNAGRE